MINIGIIRQLCCFFYFLFDNQHVAQAADVEHAQVHGAAASTTSCRRGASESTGSACGCWCSAQCPHAGASQRTSQVQEVQFASGAATRAQAPLPVAEACAKFLSDVLARGGAACLRRGPMTREAL